MKEKEEEGDLAERSILVKAKGDLAERSILMKAKGDLAERSILGCKGAESRGTLNSGRYASSR